jgi:hypothetical protein
VQTVSERFWAKVDRRGPDECWPWLASTNRYGYGRLWVDTRQRPAPQVAWEIEHDAPFPVGMMACHTCDNPPCVNPAHIWPGTMRDNIQDALRKGRMVSTIRELHANQTHCLRGHAFAEHGRRDSRGFRSCLLCTKLRNRSRYRPELRQQLFPTKEQG